MASERTTTSLQTLATPVVFFGTTDSAAAEPVAQGNDRGPCGRASNLGRNREASRPGLPRHFGLPPLVGEDRDESFRNA